MSEAAASAPPRFGEVTEDFGDGTYVFRLPLGCLRELETKCKVGAPELLMRIMMRRWWIDDLRETIRLGLIGGGGVPPVQALKLVERYVDERPYFETVPLVLRILNAVLLPPPSEKKSEEEEKEEAPIMSEAALLKLLSSPEFMETGPLWDSPRPRSTT